MLIRAAFGYLPMAFILAGGRDRRDRAPRRDHGRHLRRASSAASAASSRATSCSRSATPTRTRSTRAPGIPLFGVFLGAIVLAIGAFVLWLEMIIRDAAIYICVFFLPLTFVAMIWPATSRWARRLVELLVAIILAKFVIVAILSLATAAITNTSVANGDGDDVRADDRGRRAPRPRRLVAVRAPAADPDDGGRRRERRRVSARRCPRPPDRPASRARRATCDRRWTGTHGRRLHRPIATTGGTIVLAVAFDRADRRADGQRPARRIGDARRRTAAVASRASSSSSGGTVYPTAPAARRDSRSGSAARLRDRRPTRRPPRARLRRPPTRQPTDATEPPPPT